jgi:hypothetical protein
VDWRSKPAVRGRHGGMLAASFVLGPCKISTPHLIFFLKKLPHDSRFPQEISEFVKKKVALSNGLH